MSNNVPAESGRDADREFTVTEHLEELRKRIIISLCVTAAATILVMPFSGQLLQFLKHPAAGCIERLVYFSPEEAFLVYMRISFAAGIILSFPVIMFQLWAFLSPAIERPARRYAGSLAAASSIVFLAGCVFAYSLLLPASLKFLLSMGRGDLEPMISVTKYISFVTGFTLACGLVFEMPVLSFFLTRTGLINAKMLRSRFKYAIIIIAVAAAVITPTGDIFNMALLGLPMLALYEVSIWVSYFSKKGG